MLEQSPDGAEASDALGECSTLVELLEARQAALAATLEGAFPELRATIWQSEASVQAAVQVGFGSREGGGHVWWFGVVVCMLGAHNLHPACQTLPTVRLQASFPITIVLIPKFGVYCCCCCQPAGPDAPDHREQAQD